MRRQVGFHEAFVSVIVQWNCTISGHIAVRQHYILNLDLEEVEFSGRLYYYYAMGHRRVFSERHYLWIYHYEFLPYYAHNGLYILTDCMLNLVRFFVYCLSSRVLVLQQMHPSRMKRLTYATREGYLKLIESHSPSWPGVAHQIISLLSPLRKFKGKTRKV